MVIEADRIARSRIATALLLGIVAALWWPVPPTLASDPEQGAKKEDAAMDFVLSTPAFSGGASIPVKHTCDGEDRSPELHWTQPPTGAVSLALIVDDPDAPGGDWVHWVLFDVPASVRSLPEGVPASGKLESPAGARQGRNDFGKIGWGGPCPPPGKPHRYFFRLFALTKPLGLEPGATKADVERTMKGHVLATAEMVGTYARRR